MSNNPPGEILWNTRRRSAEEIRMARAFDRLARATNAQPVRQGSSRPARESTAYNLFDDQEAPDLLFHLNNAGQSSTRSFFSGGSSKRRRTRAADLVDEFSSFDFGPAAEHAGDTHSGPLHQHGRPADLLDGTGELQEDVRDSEGLEYEEGPTAGNKRYQSSDDPMAVWRQWRDEFLDETLRRHGLGEVFHRPQCATCGIVYKPTSSADEPVLDAREPVLDVEGATASDQMRTEATGENVSQEAVTNVLFRCRTCGEWKECESCCLHRHKRSPLHRVEVWRDECWQAMSLREMGLVYQVGHEGNSCPAPAALRLLTVIDVTGIHVVHTRLCGCSRGDAIFDWQQLLREGWYPATTSVPQTAASVAVLDMYRRLKVIATVNVRDFVSVLESTSDPYGTEWTPDRYRAFGRMARQWAFLKRVRRSGVAHETGGVDEAADGSVAISCWACPRVGVNLPAGWQTVAEKEKYIFRPQLSVDANFRLSCKMRPSPRTDDPLYSGLGVQPSFEEYHAWLRSYITEEEVLNCISFAALMNKDTKQSTGLRWTGVIGVICARHEILMGLGDLERGERYKNTDFILYWVLCQMGFEDVTITYDIACQYKINWWKRIESLPPELRTFAIKNIIWALPVWHGNAHDISCETQNSLKYQLGVGKMDGEGIERKWAAMNPMSYITKEEQPGARHDDLEDLTDLLNFKKNIEMGHTLLRRLKIALEERGAQVQGFVDVDGSLEKDLRKDWHARVDAWVLDHSQPNPYAPSGNGVISEALVRLELQKEEALEAGADEEHVAAQTVQDLADEEVPAAGRRKRGRKHRGRLSNAISQTGFLVLGLQLEELQRRIVNEKNTSSNFTVGRQTKVHERRLAFFTKLKTFRKHQEQMMPGVIDILEEDELRRQTKKKAPPAAEDVPLYLPSACVDDRAICATVLRSKEASLRRGQCGDAIRALRSRLLAKRHLVNYRNGHVTGQRDSTRAAGLISSVSLKILATAAKYRACWEALVDLVGIEECGAFKALQEGDMVVFGVDESDAVAWKKLGRLGARDAKGVGSRTAKATTRKRPKGNRTDMWRSQPGETRQKMSWIWTADGGPGESDPEYAHECVRIEWSRALARKTRWCEEVNLLEEEMRRVLRSLRWEERDWERRSQIVWHVAPDIIQGRRAFANRQVFARRRLRESFEQLWTQSGPARGRILTEADDSAMAAAAAIVSGELSHTA